MRSEILEALDAACDVAINGQRRRSRESVRAVVYAVLLELDGDLTVAQLCDELCIAAAQGPR